MWSRNQAYRCLPEWGLKSEAFGAVLPATSSSSGTSAIEPFASLTAHWESSNPGDMAPGSAVIPTLQPLSSITGEPSPEASKDELGAGA